MIQKVKDQKWIDETGQAVPIKYITPLARLKEQRLSQLLKEAVILNHRLTNFKTIVKEYCNEIYNLAQTELKTVITEKGNFTIFNFYRSIKIDVAISDRIEFDDLTIAACKAKLDEFLNENLDAKQDFIKEMVTDAFATSKGKLDVKKVMNLLKWQSKVNHPLFQEALRLLTEAIRRPDSRTYFRIWERQDDGAYKLIDLNFSSI